MAASLHRLFMTPRFAILYSYIDRYASLVVTFIASVVISRLLTPAEVGTFSVAMVLLGFLGPFRDFGASQYVIQTVVINDEILCAVRSIQFIIGMLLALLTAGASSWVADFYREPQVRDIMLLLSLNSLLLPFGVLSSALLTRELRFKELAIARFAGAITSAVLSVILAWVGRGPMSLAYGALAGTLATAVFLVLLRPVKLPWHSGINQIRHILGFGSALTGTSLLGMVYKSISELTLARLQSLAVSGLFSRAQGLVSMLERLLMEGAYAVAVPIFAKAHREKNALEAMYIKSIGLISVLGWAFFGLFICIAAPLIEVLYGHQWLGAVPIAQSLCAAIMLLTPNLLYNQLLIAMGKARLVFISALASTALQVCVVIVAAQQSVEAVCIALIAAAMLTTVPMTIVTQRLLGFQWISWGKALSHSAVIAISSLLVPVAVLFNLDGNSILSVLLISCAGSVIGLLAAVRITRHHLFDEIQRLLGRSH